MNNLLLTNTLDQNGCDSIVNLTVERLNILQGFIEDPICTSEGITLQFNYISDLSTDLEFLNFNWTDPSGSTLPHGADPTSVTAPFESGNGTYSLVVTIEKNGSICTYEYFASVDINSFLPPNPTIDGPQIVCEGDDMSSYTAIGDSSETIFIWSVPNNVANAITSVIKMKPSPSIGLEPTADSSSQ